MFWLLEQNAYDAMNAARLAGFKLSDEQHKEFMTKAYADDDNDGYGGGRIMSVAGNVAQITIAGVMTNKPNFMAYFFGGGNTTYPEIIKAVAAAESNPRIQTVDFVYDTPGGMTDGMYEAIQAIQSSKKPKRAFIRMAASAGYALAANSGKMIAMNVAAQVGSIGIVSQFRVQDDVIEITSSNAPKKRPDPTTAEGKAVIVEYLDAIEKIFIEAIATGRGVTSDKITAGYGQGAMFLAQDALTKGMIDEIEKPKLSVVSKSSATSGNTKGVQTMDLETLKAQHPAVYQLAVNEGVKKERERACAHLTLADASRDLGIAVKAIQEGTELTVAVQAQYLAASMKKQNRTDRIDDDKDASKSLDGADKNKESNKPAADQVYEMVAAALSGVDVE